jgi:putative NADH-flavin reductase
MRIFVLGATGATGSLFVDAALAAGHEVIAFVRNPAKVDPRDGLAVLTGDVLDADSMAEAMRGADAVVSMLGPRSLKPAGFGEQTLRAIVNAAERSGTERVLVMSAFGVGDSSQKASSVARVMYRTGARAIYADKAAGERVLIASALDWTLAYPVVLTNGPKSETFRAIDLEEMDHLGGLPRVSRADVAGFLLEAAVTDDWSRRTVVLTTGGARPRH